MGVTFEGGAFGGKCEDTVYATAGTGWAFCDDGKWAYTTMNPSDDGYTPFTPTSDGGHEHDGGLDANQGTDSQGQGGDGGHQGQGDDGGRQGKGDDGGQQGLGDGSTA
jgi:hypothetical protein